MYKKIFLLMNIKHALVYTCFIFLILIYVFIRHMCVGKNEISRIFKSELFQLVIRAVYFNGKWFPTVKYEWWSKTSIWNRTPPDERTNSACFMLSRFMSQLIRHVFDQKKVQFWRRNVPFYFSYASHWYAGLFLFLRIPI